LFKIGFVIQAVCTNIIEDNISGISVVMQAVVELRWTLSWLYLLCYYVELSVVM